jgi:hypothetical protein
VTKCTSIVTGRSRKQDDKKNRFQEWEREELAYNHTTAIFFTGSDETFYFISGIIR